MKKTREAAQLKAAEKEVEIVHDVDKKLQENIAENRSIIEQRAESIKRAFLFGADLEFGAQVEKDPEQFKCDLDRYCEEWLKTYTPTDSNCIIDYKR